MGIDKWKKSLFGDTEGEDSNDVSIDDVPCNNGETTLDALQTEGNKMILFEPRAYSESQQIADYLKNKNAVIVNLKRVTPDQAKRIVDFISGTLYAIEGGLQKLGGGIFLCTPNNVPVVGKISDDVPQEKVTKKPRAEKDEDEEKYF